MIPSSDGSPTRAAAVSHALLSGLETTNQPTKLHVSCTSGLSSRMLHAILKRNAHSSPPQIFFTAPLCHMFHVHTL